MDRAPDGRPAFGAYWRVDGCYHDPDDAPDSLLTEGTIIGNGVILPDAVQRGLLDQCSREVPRRAEFEWTPSVAMIADLERASGLARGAGRQPPVPLDRYWRQTAVRRRPDSLSTSTSAPGRRTPADPNPRAPAVCEAAGLLPDWSTTARQPLRSPSTGKAEPRGLRAATMHDGRLIPPV
ncbi:MAG: hypothetical protein IPK12_24735 [Gemmatimonadetes bacterium]|nr:hypothetical protein [Gemmatimonadota bacterium]